MIALRIARESRELYDETYDSELKRLSDSNASKKVPMTNTPVQQTKTPKSRVVPIALTLLLLSLILGVISISTPVFATLAVVIGLAGVTMAVLSLREL